MDQKRLLVGFDLCNDFSRISVYNEKTFEPKCIGKSEDEKSQRIPTVLVYRDATGEWLYGEDALSLAKDEKDVLIENMINHILENRPFIINGKEIDASVLLSLFFRKTLSILKMYYPTESIRKIVITVEKQDSNLDNSIFKAMEQIGIGRDRLSIQTHKMSFLYYALSQKKEFWLNDVGLFDFNTDGLYYYQMKIDRSKSPMLVGIIEKNFSETLKGKMLNTETIDTDVCYLFENIARSALHKQIITTLYVTGKGFEGNWAQSVFQKFCVGRRVFQGENLYVSGACHAARELSGEGKLEEFIYLDEDMISSHVVTAVYVDGMKKDLILAKAGTPWYQIDNSIDVIADNEMELEIQVKSILKRVTSSHIIPLEILEHRVNKMSRITIRVRFTDVHTCVITMKDNGFGEFCKSSNRIWEKTITV